MFNEYRMFVRIIETGSLSATARELRLAPAQVSRRLAHLESRLGARLIERTTRRIALTDVGRQFFESVRPILDSVSDAEAAVSGRSTSARGMLQISAPTSFGRKHLAPHLKRFLDAHPDLTLQLNLSDLFVDLEAEGVDVALRIAVIDERDETVVRLADNRRVLCASPAYIAEHGEPLTLHELSRHRLLAADNQSPWRLATPMGSVLYRVRSFVRTNSSEVMRELIVAGVGIGLRSIWDVSEELADGRLKVVLPDHSGATNVGIYGIRSPRRANAAGIDAFIAFLRELYGPTPPWEAGR
jgi:DNA-binding transcriptional LysR family regulator